MATIKLDPKYERLSDEFVIAFHNRGVILSDYAEGLLRLSVESWFEEPLQLPNASPSARNLAMQIVFQTLEEEHVKKRVKDKKPVPYNELLYALGRSGRQVLGEFLDKGP